MNLDQDLTGYRAWDDLPGDGDLTSWDSATGLSWSSTEPGDVPISGALWSDFYGAMSLVVVGDEYWMYDTMDGDNYSIGLLTAPIPTQAIIPEPATIVLLALGGLGLLAGASVRRRRRRA